MATVLTPQTVRALKSLVTSDASDEVAKFQSEFAALTDVFDRGTLVQVLDAVMSSGSFSFAFCPFLLSFD